METHRHDARACWWDHRACRWVCPPEALTAAHPCDVLAAEVLAAEAARTLPDTPAPLTEPATGVARAT
ncbi:MAG TPA: hypothetical protein VFJ12_06585 [Segeticoccus sp.]|jgi:hypothetical protein|nr:hypothetical protein [Segeticoccus sp.]